MPFNSDYRKPYTHQAISDLDRKLTGAYGIFRGNTCIYVGGGKLRDRMLAHFNGEDPCITREKPDWWTAVTVAGDYEPTEGRLAREYRPVCGTRHPQVT